MFARLVSASSRATACTFRRSIATTTGVSVNEPLLVKMREDLDKERRLNVPPNRHTAFLKAMEVIGGLKYEITNAEMVQNLDGVGIAAARRIQKLLPSNSSNLSKAKKDKIIAELTTIEGLTARRAIRLIDAGCGSKEDLNDPKFFNLLTKALQVNVKYDSHLAQPVTHEQTERFADFLRNQLSSSYEIIPVGSYRRGASASASARILFINSSHMHVPTPPPPPQGALQPTRSATLRAPGFLKDFPIHSTLVPQLNDWGLIVSHRACTWSNWNGVIRLPQRSGKRWEPVSERRRAIRKGQGEYVLGRLFMLPEKSRGAALLHHTGSKSFVRTLTLRAEQMGLYFASTGLWKWHSDEEMEAMAGEGEGEESGDAQGFWQLLPSTDEEMIFEHLQMEFIEPTRRRALTPGRDL